MMGHVHTAFAFAHKICGVSWCILYAITAGQLDSLLNAFTPSYHHMSKSVRIRGSGLDLSVVIFSLI